MLAPEGTKCFVGDLPEQEQKVVWATHYAPSVDLLQQQPKVDLQQQPKADGIA